MKVCVEVVPATLSRAMHRVAHALRMYAPAEVELVRRAEEADLQVVHTVGLAEMGRVAAPEIAIIQYCYGRERAGAEWHGLWRKARLVWSYYDLAVPSGVRFYYAPLGVDGGQFELGDGPRPVGVVTSGCVAGPGAEAIEEVADAALRSDMSVAHLGPRPVGMLPRTELSWRMYAGLLDDALTELYQSARWVSGLRFVEGFELPALEGLACGARPIVFNRADMHWYRRHAVFVQERSGPALVEELQSVLARPPQLVTALERAEVVEQFNWQSIAQGFWRELL